VAELRDRVRDLADDASYYERIRLGELVADEVARRRDVDTRRVLDVLEPLAVAARDEPAADPNAAFNLAFLVRRDEEQTFGEAVGLLVRELGERVQLRFVGPLPPYSFTDGSLTAGSAGWA